MRRVLCLATLLLVTAFAFAQTSSSSSQSSTSGQSGSMEQSGSMGQSGSMEQSGSMGQSGSASSDEQQLLSIEQQWADAMKSGDASVVQRIEADDYKLTNAEGVTSTKQDDINGLRTGQSKYQSVELSDLKPQVNGDTATVTGKITLKGTEKGKDISGTYDFTDTFAKHNGTWQAISSQSHKVPSGPQ